MRINIFEGARRIALLTAAIWAVAVGWFLVVNEPTVPLYYRVGSVGLVNMLPVERCGSEDLSDAKYVKTKGNTSVRMSFCFVAHKMDTGEWMIPYKIDDKNPSDVWMNEKYSPVVTEYRRRVVRDLEMSAQEEGFADMRYWPERRKQLFDGALWLIGGWIAIGVFTWVTGWIVRGFAGIPMRKDRRPE